MSTTEIDIPPECTVRFDDRAGCGVNLARHDTINYTFVDIAFVTYDGPEDTHSLTLDQAEQLRAVLDALLRQEAAPDRWVHTVADPLPAQPRQPEPGA